jgi:hypothetical protein
MHGTARDDDPASEPSDSPAFPTTLSLRHMVAYPVLDDDGVPVLILTDGVSAVALESGLAGPCAEVVVAARRLGAVADDFAASIAELLPEAKDRPPGRRPPNRRGGPGPKSGTP